MCACILIAIAVGSCSVAFGQGAAVRLVADFEDGGVENWQTSMSPEYYKGGHGRKGLEVIDDPQRGNVLRCDIRFVDKRGSEPAFITRYLDPKPRRAGIVGVRFWAKITEPAVAETGGFKVRLRTSPRSFTDYDVQKQLGGPFPVDQWVHVQLDTTFGPNVRNIWNDVLSDVMQMTFRLDDIDDRNAQFALLLDDIELVLKHEPAEAEYQPQVHERPPRTTTRVLLLKHSAVGYYDIAQAIGRIAPDAQLHTHLFRGLHFELFGFPNSLDRILTYDLIVMVDVDPFVMTQKQCRWVADAVASGAHLLLFAGPSTLTHAHSFPPSLRAVIPATFAEGANDITVNASPAPHGDHFLNRGIDPAGLGRVASVLDLTPAQKAQVPWVAADRPLVITGPVQNGRCTIVNTWPSVSRTADGDFFTSVLSDDLMRKLAQFALARQPTAEITSLRLPELSALGDGALSLQAAVETDADTAGIRLQLVAEDGAEIPAASASDGHYEFTVPLDQPSDARVRVPLTLQAAANDGSILDYRDFAIDVHNPLRLDVAWQHNKSTFAPGGPVELTASLQRRDIPRIDPGRRVRIAYAQDRFPVSIDNFTDSWVYKPGTEKVIHNQLGAADVEVTPRGGLLPSWTVTGRPRSARRETDLKFAEDDRILECRRRINALERGAVEVVTHYEFRHDMRVQRLPLTISLPVSVYAGLKYRAEQAEGVREGAFPVDTKRGKMFDGTGLDMTIDTPQGTVRIQVLDPSLRVWLRDLRQYDMTTYRFEIEAPYEDSTAQQGDGYTIPVRISGPVPGGIELPDQPLTIKAEILDPRTDYRWVLPAVTTDPGNRFRGQLPNLRTGDYMLQVTAAPEGHQHPVVTTTRPCHVVDPLRLSDFFPLMSIVGLHGGGHYLDETGIRRRLQDMWNHGLNTAAIPGVGSFRANSPRNSDRLKGYAESCAQRMGMATTFEYSNFQLMGRNEKVEPCPFSSDYYQALKDRIDWQVDIGRRVPRLLTAKVIDEPVAGQGNMDYCDHCKQAFRKRYGIELKPLDDYGDDPYARWAFADFIGHYVSTGYAQGAHIMRELDAPFDLLLTYMATGLGYQRPLSYQQDTLDWTRHVEWADFDVYPYFYPASQRIRMVQAGFAMAFMRDVARARAVPWGFYVELDDRNWPYQKNPKEASAECAYTAVARGANYLNTFIHRLFGTGTGARPQRWEQAGMAFRTLRRIGPLLNRMKAIKTPAALFFPQAQQFIANGYPQPHYTLAALYGTIGPVDIHNEQVIVENGDIDYRALFLFRTEFLHADAVPIIEQWLRDGGILICDSLPEKTHRGEPINWGFDNEGPENLAAGLLRARARSVGNGRLMLLENDIEAEFRDLVEADQLDPEAVRQYRAAIADLFADLHITSVSVDYAETPESVDLIEAGLRGAENARMLTVVNHQPSTQTVTAHVLDRGWQWACDVASMEPVPFRRSADDRIALDLEIDGRGARLITLYRTQPVSLQIELETTTLRPTDMLTYSVSPLDADGRPVQAPLLFEIQVTDPNGQVVSRYGGSRASSNGTVSVETPIPDNAVPGDYTIAARAPQFGATAGSSFTISR